MRRARSVVAGIAILAAAAAFAPAGAIAAPARTARSLAPATGQPAYITAGVHRFNEDATHSPQLEHQLAARAARRPGREAGLPAAARPHSGQPAGAAPAGTPSASPTSVPDGASAVEGLDVASFQHAGGPISWSGVASAGYEFAFIKATEGSYYANPYYQGDTASAQGAGLVTAPYAFAIPNYSGGALQADYALDKSGFAPDGQLLPLILDIEYDPYDAPVSKGGDGTNECYGLTPAQMVSWISAFTTEAQRRTGQLPVIYTTADWWHACTANSPAFTADPLWIANYEVSAPAMPPGWASYTYWQYTAGATLPSAITGVFDASWLSSSALELAGQASQSDQAGATVSLAAGFLNGTAAGPAYTATGLPAGLTINPSSGAISGELSGPARTFGVSVTATATGAASVTRRFTWYVHDKVSLAKIRSQGGSAGSPVRLQVTAADGLPGCSLQYRATKLPAGVTISSCGLISGWLERNGVHTVTVSATDSSGVALAARSFTWKISRASGHGPAGQIGLRRDGKCLEARSGTDIAIGTCSTWSRQQWTIAADGTLRNDGDCLTAAAVKTGNGKLSLTACGTSVQHWQLGTGGTLTDQSTQFCLADTGTKNASRAYASACTGSTSQRWTLPAGSIASGIPGLCASSLHGVSLGGCSTAAPQQWIFKTDGELTSGSKCLEPAGGKTSRGTRLTLASCSSKSALQQWQLTAGQLGQQIVSPVAGLCLADPADATRSGTALRLEPCVAADPGTWWRVS
jgi:GH25 family lysozyme M1 (1,4-beta-N-acetylmuramidase)